MLRKTHDVLLKLLKELERSPSMDKFDIQTIAGQIAAMSCSGSKEAQDSRAASTILLIANAMYSVGKEDARVEKKNKPIELELVYENNHNRNGVFAV